MTPRGVRQRLLWWVDCHRWQAVIAAGSSLALWFAGSSATAQVGASREVLRLALVNPAWAPQWSVVPWLLALCGAAPAWLRWSTAPGGAPSDLGRRALRLTSLILVLCAAKAASLWGAVTGFFPYLTLLWSPHATWAVALVFALWWHVPGPGGERCGRAAWDAWDARIAWLFALAALAAYGVYALYFCQMALLHGDEGPYLSVTQSLLHDGDIDLSNNLSKEANLEFHVRTFGVGKAPASPLGRFHSVHPVGLSALLVPPYYVGLRLWSNPRLACALAIVALSAGCVGLCFTWLRRIGFERPQATVATVSMAASAPFFSFSNQLYPEVPALFVALVLLVLLAHWQRPGGGYVPLGPLEPAILGACTLAIAGLGFLHPRLLVLGAALGVLLLPQAWYGPRRGASLGAIAAAAAAGGWALVRFNLAFSGDWMGPFRPANACGDDALQPATWVVSLPGQWLDERMGLGAVAPVYLLALPGLIYLVARRDRRVAVAAALYASTALVNGLHPLWTFGFCFPARFMVCALPALVCGLARFLEVAWGRAIPLVAFAAALALSVDSTLTTVEMPELAYTGLGLEERLFCRYYPWETLFVESDQQSFPWAEAGFWAIVVGALAVAWWPSPRWARKVRFAGLGMAALLPAFWGWFGVSGTGFEGSRYMPTLPREAGQEAGLQTRREFLSSSSVYRNTTGHLEGDAFVARQGEDGRGILAAYRLGTLRNGMYSIVMKGVEVAAAEGLTQGHLLVSRRPAMPALAPWEERVNLPLQVRDGAMCLDVWFIQRRLQLGYALVAFSGYGKVRIGGLAVTELPIPFQFREQLIERVDFTTEESPTPQVAHRASVSGLGPGLYTARFEFAGLPL